MRKKKLRLLAVLLAACMLCSCSAPVYPRSTDEPQLQFYYCTGEGADTGIGALAAKCIVFCIGLLAVAALCMTLVVKRTLAPLSVLQKGVKRVAAGKYDEWSWC